MVLHLGLEVDLGHEELQVDLFAAVQAVRCEPQDGGQVLPAGSLCDLAAGSLPDLVHTVHDGADLLTWALIVSNGQRQELELKRQFLLHLLRLGCSSSSNGSGSAYYH